MAYNPNIPQSTDIIANSQSDILNNFQALNNVFGVNHLTFEAPGQGKHAFLQMPEYSGSVSTAIDEAGLYAAIGASSAQTELVFRRENNGATIAFTECLAGATGWTRLPSGILAKWGNASAQGLQTITFNAQAPFMNVFVVLIGQQTSNGSTSDGGTYAEYVDCASPYTSFRVWGGRRDAYNDADRPAYFSYLAIGV
jgi:hypothetical protein